MRGDLTPAVDASPANWIVEAMTTFGKSVTGFVPAGFEAYVRVFHPAYRWGDGARRWETRIPVTWSEIAAANGTRVHAGMQLGALAGRLEYQQAGQPGVYDRAPQEGVLPPEVAPALTDVLSNHTATPETCWFAFWNGYAGIRENELNAPSFTIPARSYFLFRGAIGEAPRSGIENRFQPANLWWPDDRAWCVHTEIDSNTTYVGCSAGCRDGLLANDRLEAFEIDPDAATNWFSDQINPEPGRG